VMLTMSGCASWCDNSDNQAKCLSRVHTAQTVALVTAVVVTAGAAAYAVKRGGGGGDYSQSQYPGNCQHTWQYASDGSICGNRAADARPGGW
jgi:hypothetical protein